MELGDFQRQIDTFNTQVEKLRQHVGPSATVMAGNRVIRSAVPIVVERVKAEVPAEVKKIHIRGRIKTWNMSAKQVRPQGKMFFKISDLPAIRLGFKKKENAIRFTPVAKFTEKGRRSKRGPGIKIGTKTFKDGFVNVPLGQYRRGGNYQVLQRETERTWRPGEHGWKYWPYGASKTAMRGNRAAIPARAPYRLIKYDLETPFRRHYRKSLQLSIDRNYQKEFNRAMELGLARLQIKRRGR